MKPSDVTDAMVGRVETMSDAMVEMMTTNAGENHNYVRWEYDTPKEIIAASVNTFLGDATPITVEWLLANGWEKNERRDRYEKHISDDLGLLLNKSGVFITDGFDAIKIPHVKSLSQLRALEIGLGLHT